MYSNSNNPFDKNIFEAKLDEQNTETQSNGVDCNYIVRFNSPQKVFLDPDSTDALQIPFVALAVGRNCNEQCIIVCGISLTTSFGTFTFSRQCGSFTGNTTILSDATFFSQKLICDIIKQSNPIEANARIFLVPPFTIASKSEDSVQLFCQ